MPIQIIPLAPEVESSMISTWISAIELRNGDQYYISNKTQQAVINYNFYVFQDFNLFYYCKRDRTTTFIGNIPTHTPKSLALIPNSNNDNDGVDEGNQLLVMVSSCLLSFDVVNDPYAHSISVEAGNCYESGMRDGPRQFARFNSLGSIAASRRKIWAISDNIIVPNVVASRLVLMHNSQVTTFGDANTTIKPFPAIHAMSVSTVVKEEEEEVFIAVCWSEGGLSIIWIPKYTMSLHALILNDNYKILSSPSIYHNSIYFHFAQIVVNSITLLRKEREGKRQLYLFLLAMNKGVMKDLVEWKENSTELSLGYHSTLESFQEKEGEGTISLYVDFPYGVFIANGNYKNFIKVNTLGCVCPPGFALLASSQLEQQQEPHCQLAPLGGYVDILGNFIACPPGTYGDKRRATSREACLPCPPFTISNMEQSISCSVCFEPNSLAPAVQNPSKTGCIAKGLRCPEGSYLGRGACLSCAAGYSSHEGENCTECPSNTFSDPSIGILKCTACPLGTIANPGASTCSTLCNLSSSCAPRGSALSSCEAKIERKDLVLTISILGTKAVGAALAKNGTVYIAGFQLLITIEKSGTSINTPLSELTLVRDLELSWDESILYAAVSSQEILCFTHVGTRLVSWTRLSLLPNTAIVGICLVRLRGNEMLLAHDALTNAIYRINLETSEWARVYSGESDGGAVVSMTCQRNGNTPVVYVLIQNSIIFDWVDASDGNLTLKSANASVSSNSSSSSYVMISSHNSGSLQKVVKLILDMMIGQSSVTDTLTVPKETILNPHMVYWRDKLFLSIENSVGFWEEEKNAIQILVGVPGISGRVDNIGEAARFTVPGPMMPFGDNTLLVVDHTALRAVYALGDMCQCDEDFYLMQKENLGRVCLQCPQGQIALSGAVGGCSNCARGQYYDSIGKCVPCPKMIWWEIKNPASCPLVLDTMVNRDSAGLSMQDIFWEMSDENPQHYEALNLMKSYDYVSMHTLQLPLSEDSLMQDNAVQGRFWVRSKRITPPPEIFISTSPNTPLHTNLQVTLPGFWIICSSYVLQTETCSCDLPAGGIRLGGNDDITQLWNQERSRAAKIDYSALLITLPPDPDLYDGGGIEYIHFMNISVAPTALFVSRTDAGGGTDDDNPSVIYVDSVLVSTQVPIPPPPEPTPSESSFAACVAGWPATYSCPNGFLWVAPLYTCVPCKPGFYHDYSISGQCLPCPIGTFSPLEGSTECSVCASSRTSASSLCVAQLQNNNDTIPSKACIKGYEKRVDVNNEMGQGASAYQCLPCIPGFFKAVAGDSMLCAPCAAGSYSSNVGSTACTRCSAPLVSTQWGSTECIACAKGYVPASSSLLNRCRQCAVGSEYYAASTCKNKTVLRCSRGYYLKDGGSISDNQCVACLACRSGEIMTPFDPHPCNYEFTVSLGAPYRCVPVESVPGLFARLALQALDIHNFSIQYTPCEGLPSYATWAQGPDPSLCYFQCNYAISEAGAREYAYFYLAEQGSMINSISNVLSLPIDQNIFLLDYPGLSMELMILSKEICLPCPKSQCGWGKYRPITDAVHGCGPPTCVLQAGSCQVVPGGIVTQYKNDGCVENCSFPTNAYLSSLAPPGTGDNCGWKCKLGFFKDTFVLDMDENETGYTCTQCKESICEKGESFVAHKCLPDSKKESFCIPCPMDTQKKTTVLSITNSIRGVCKYECLPGSYYDTQATGIIPTCVSCSESNTYCPSGFRRVCSAETCIACPNLLPSLLWGSAVKMPSNKDTCQVACRSGYHTIDLASGQVIPAKSLALSYDADTIACTLCSLRPSIQCNTMTCSAGYYMPVIGSGICKPCPTVYDCGPGLAPSSSGSCLCTLCQVKIADAVFIQQREAESLALPVSIISKEIVLDYGSCPAVCMNNKVLASGPLCNPCSALVNPDPKFSSFTAYYAVWNASKGIRWWDASQDPPHLPQRKIEYPLTEERRAGLCWPCPPGTITGIGDTDLCKTVMIVNNNNNNIIKVNQAVFDSNDVILTAGTEIVNSISSIVYSIFSSAYSSIPIRYSSVSLSAEISNRTTTNTTIQTLQNLSRGRRLLASASQTPGVGLPQQIQKTSTKHRANIKRKKRQKIKGIRVQSHKRIIAEDQQLNMMVQAGMIQTCPAFARWQNTECVCKAGFQRHANQDICVRNVGRNRTSSIAQTKKRSMVVAVVDNEGPEPEVHCAMEGACSQGKYRDAHGTCRLCPTFLHVYDESVKECRCRLASGCEACQDRYYYRDLSQQEAPCTKCPDGMVALHPINYGNSIDACVCPKGTEARQDACVPCPKGTYSQSMGLSLCTPCPAGFGTLREGSESARDCIQVGTEEDAVFVHHGAAEFYHRAIQKTMIKE